ncbi:MAG: hypothetical protein QOI95_2786 [Acidimicrobiaceae bacterium]|jgi:hypothetical protein
MTGRRLLLLLAPAGSLAAHGLAYGPFTGGHDHADDGGLHAYLPLVAAVAVPVAIAALLWAAASRPGRAVSLPSVRALVGTQLGLFVVQEVVERLATHVSLSDLASQPAIRWGLALQLLTATTCAVTTRLLRRTVGAFLAMTRRADLLLAVPSVLVSIGGAVLVALGIVWRPPSRAPPVVAA